MKKWFGTLFALIALLLCAAFLPIRAEAAVVTSGTCGDNLIWVLEDNGTLTISGSGDMYDYGNRTAPWYSRATSIATIDSFAFFGNRLTDVYYSGTEEQWSKVAIDAEGNDNLLSAKIHYNA